MMHNAFQQLLDRGYINVDEHLCVLAEAGDVDAIQNLGLDNPTELKLYDMALTAGHIKILQKLSAETKNQMLMLSASKGNTHNLYAILKYHQFMNAESILKAFHLAVAEGHVEVVNALMHTFKRIITQTEIKTALQTAIQNNNPAIVKILYKPEFLSLLYQEELPNFARLIFRAEPPDVKEDVKKTQMTPHYTIHNQAGYEQCIEQDLVKGYTEGNALSLEDGTPIGYVAYVPENVKAVCVNIYGGGGEPYIPTYYTNEWDYLNSQGIAVVNLNLVDLIELKTYQLEMPRELHQKIHDSINHAFSTLKHSPSSLHPELGKLKNLPFFLKGSSFGGTMAVKHAEMRPSTFDGYISNNGDLSIVKSFKASKFNPYEPDQAVVDAQTWLCPTFDIDALKDPVLLLQNLDDNNVNFPVTVDFMKKAKRADKEELIRLLVTEHGGPVVPDELMNTGHTLPSNTKSLERILSAQSSFMLNGPSFSPDVSLWRAHKYRVYSQQENPIASLEDVFISMAFALYQERSIKKVSIDKITPQDIISKSSSRREKAWQYYYQPIYRVLYYIDKLKKDPKTRERHFKAHKTRGWVLYKEAVNKALNDHLTDFARYIKERYGFDYDPKTLSQDKGLQDTFKEILLSPSETYQDTYLYLLSKLLLARPVLIENETTELVEYPSEQAQLAKAQERFTKEINKYKTNIRAIWKEAAKKSQDLSTKPAPESPFLSMDFFQIRKIFQDAASDGNINLIKLMLSNSQLQISDEIKQDAFLLAVSANKFQVLEYLLSICPEAIKKETKIEALKRASLNDYVATFDFLMKQYGRRLKHYELIQALGPELAKAFKKDIKPAKKWPSVVTEENQQPNISTTKKPRSLPLTPQKVLKQAPQIVDKSIKRPLPVRPKGK